MGGLISEGTAPLVPPPATPPPIEKRGILGRRRVSRRTRRLIRRTAIAIGALVVFLLLAAAVGAVYAGPSAFRAARDGRAALMGGRDAFLKRDASAARREFVRAEGLFRSAEGRLGSPLIWPLQVIPVAKTHVNVARTLTAIGARVAEAGRGATAAMEELPGHELKLVEGRVDLAASRRALGEFGGSVAAAGDIAQELERMPSGWVTGTLSRARKEAIELLPTAIDGMQKGQTALEALPSLLAEHASKRYLIAFSNLSELRGTGGFIGFVTVLKAEGGDLDLEDVSGRPTELFPPPGESNVEFPDWFPADFRKQSGIFQNVNLTTDFPTVGRLIVQTARSAIGGINGVIGVDPIGLSAVLRATGPITVASWPEAINADNVSRIAQHDVYLRIRNNAEREDFFAQLVRTTFDRLVTVDVPFRPETFGSFDGAVRAGHFRMFSIHPDDQATFTELGLEGGVERTRGATDVLSVVSQNATGNKSDWFLHRELRYRVRLDPRERRADAELVATFNNTAPSSGLPDYVIGTKYAGGLPPGTNRQNVTLVRSAGDELRAIMLNGKQIAPIQAPEGSLRSYRSTTEIGSRSTSELRVRSSIPQALRGSGRHRTYRLHVLPQPVVNNDFLEVEIDVPSGWRIEGTTTFSGDLQRDEVLEVRVSQTWRALLFERVFQDPWRLAKDLVGRIF